MSTHFIGLLISAELSNGTLVEGIVHHIDPSSGKLNLAQARFLRHDGSFSDPQPNFILDKDSVKDLMLLSNTRQTTSTTQASPTYDPSHHHHSSHPKITSSHHRDINPTTTPGPSTNSSTPSRSDQHLGNIHHHLLLPHHDPKNTKPITPATHPRRRKRPQHHNQTQSSNHRHPRNDDPDDPKPTCHGPDSGFSAHEDTDGIPTPELSPPIPATRVETASTPKILTSDFSQDFDFQAGLLAFDKAKLWAEIASTDSTDPKDRLVAHNRKKTNEAGSVDQAKSIADHSRHRNLAPTEMVLSAQEQVTNGSTVSNPWLLSPNNTDSNRQLAHVLSHDGHPIYPVKLDRLTHALSSASVVHGPSLVQRIENAGRSMTDYIIRLVRTSSPAKISPHKINSNMIISILVGSQGPKASCAVRTGALLARKGFKVFLALNSPSNDRKPHSKPKNSAFEFQLRSLGSAGVIVCSDVNDLPSSPTLIIEALAENSTTSLRNHQEPFHKTWVAYTHRAPTISIDMPSYLNYDTGEPLVGSAHIPAHDHLICLGALPNGALSRQSIPSEVCLVDLMLSDACWKGKEDEGDEPIQPTEDSDLVSPATWGDEWYTTIKLV